MKKCTLDDIEWLMEAGQKFYGHRLKNLLSTAKWLENSIVSEKFLVMRTQNAAIIATVSFMPFSDIPLASVFLFAGHPIGVKMLFEEAKKWAKEKGAEKLHFRSTTEHDIEKMAKILGADIEYPAYSLRL